MADGPLRVVVAGLGVQGHKRRAVAGAGCVATVDPFNPDAQHRDIRALAPESYDAVLVCTPDTAKVELLTYLLGLGKHVLVEKPLLADDDAVLAELDRLARANKAVCYTAYNHRFEPHFAKVKAILDSGELGRLYSVRMFYGNGTARLVRDSAWRDTGAGVLPDLHSHLLDTLSFWLGRRPTDFRLDGAWRHENRAFDHVLVRSDDGDVAIQLEAMLCAWRNHFTADLYAEKGSLHIESLCKWGPSTLSVRTRVLPSGRPPERSETLIQADPTWVLEYDHFKWLCRHGGHDLATDRWINDTLRALAAQAGVPLTEEATRP